MKIIQTELPGALVLEPKIFGDPRGYFFELWRNENLKEIGIQNPFVQDNVSLSQKGVLRGLHYQDPFAQGKLVSVLQGSILDIAVDLRKDSPTFLKWFGVELSQDNKRQFFVPPSFAHGFLVLSQEAIVMYKCTDYYHPETEKTILWNDPDLDVRWPIQSPALSERDSKGKTLRQLGLLN